MDSSLETIWSFVRGDLRTEDFEQSLYAHGELESAVGAAGYLALISTDFRDPEAVRAARAQLEAYARSITAMPCECFTLPTTAVIDMAHPGHALDHFQEEVQHGDPYWWLYLARCTVCGTPWLVAQEERQNDVFILRRVTDQEAHAVVAENRWPSYLDLYETLLTLGRDAGHSAVFLDPVGDSSLVWTMADLARERPGITVPELAALLNLDLDTAAVIAEQAVLRDGAVIDLGGGIR